MQRRYILSIVAAAIVAVTSAGADNISPKELKAIENADVPIHSYYCYNNPAYKPSKKDLEYYRSIGLIKKNRMINKEIKKSSKSLTQTPAEILEAFAYTIDAMKALEKNDTKSAQKDLEEATQRFEKVLKANPALKLVPVAADVEVTDHPLTVSEAEKIKKDAQRLLQKNRTQDAIDLLLTLRNQITIDTTYLPMALYPVATKTALDTLKSGKDAKVALAILLEGIDTIVHAETVVPISLLVAQEAIETAHKLDQKEKEKAAKLLDLAQKELKLAEVEGYIAPDDPAYKMLVKEITSLQTKVSSGEAQQSDYAVSQSKMQGLIDSVAKEEKQALQNPHMTEGNPHAKAKVEETESKDEFEAKMDRLKFEKEAQQDEKKSLH